MEIQAFDETMQTFKRRLPFRPFTVKLINGSAHEVDHPDMLVIREGVALYAAPGGIPVIFDHEGVVEVTALFPTKKDSRLVPMQSVGFAGARSVRLCCD